MRSSLKLIGRATCAVTLAMCATAAEQVRYAGAITDSTPGWGRLVSEAGIRILMPFEGNYASKGDRIQSPWINLNKVAGAPAYDRLTFTAKTDDHGYGWVDFQDTKGTQTIERVLQHYFRTTTNVRPPPLEVQAIYAKDPVTIEGRLDDAVWALAPDYKLRLGEDRSLSGDVLNESGRVRFAWNDDYLYAAFEFTDSDVVAEGTEDGEQHFSLGDVAEFFLWPDEHSWYWELYATPHGKQSSFFFPSSGRMLPSSFKNHLHLQVASQIHGTLNNWNDRDEGWTAEMAIPVKEITAHGDGWGPNALWRVLIGRYNYSAYLPKPELSAMPHLSKTNYHLLSEYARLRLLPQ